MPKRKVKEEKPRKRLGKKRTTHSASGYGSVFTCDLGNNSSFAPPPTPLEVCLKGHNVDTFSIHPTVEVSVNGEPKLLPAGIGNDTVDGKECLRTIHTDTQGSTIHIEYVRPIRLTLDDFMKIYSPDNSTIQIMDNLTGSFAESVLISVIMIFLIRTIQKTMNLQMLRMLVTCRHLETTW